MASERVGDMTRAELEAWMNELINRRFKGISDENPDERTPIEVFESMRKNILKRKPGQPSIVEMIREDRDR
jgi:hypothetical protein